MHGLRPFVLSAVTHVLPDSADAHNLFCYVPLLQITIGVAHNVAGVLKRRRGINVAISVNPSDGADTVLRLAVQKHAAYGHIGDGTFVLLYPVSFDEVVNIPGNANKPFTVDGYKKDKGVMQYERVLLLICATTDYRKGKAFLFFWGGEPCTMQTGPMFVAASNTAHDTGAKQA